MFCLAPVIACMKCEIYLCGWSQVSLFWCRGCGRYQKPPWVSAELESRELLALCLKKIKGLNKDVKVRVVPAFMLQVGHQR